ncbi:MAG: DUF2167 domain-containing protein [Deltaproteobacteria bacterium]|nr:DUF2167 domain-containing protein [Deltaproteobacteria bacterium]
MILEMRGGTMTAHRALIFRRALLACLASALLFSLAGTGAWAQEAEGPMLNWQQGPMTAPIGSDLASMNIDENYVYLDAEETKRFLEMNENVVGGIELATIAPVVGEWFVIFEFEDSGYISDSEKGDLDAAAMLESLRAGNEMGNEERRKRGWAEYTIVGWQEEPHYDERTNNLSWAITGESRGYRNVNRMIKLLGRRGVMTATLVASPEQLSAAISEMDALLESYQYLPGNQYAEYIPGKDKLAEYGLTALVVGGVGAALVKSGLLAKFWKPIAVALAALGTGIKRFFFSGRSAQHDPEKPIS